MYRVPQYATVIRAADVLKTTNGQMELVLNVGEMVKNAFCHNSWYGMVLLTVMVELIYVWHRDRLRLK